MSKNKNIVCFGEVLWDMLPTGKIAGGAPMNVAVHANQLGMEAQIISAVGEDDLGKELRYFLEKRSIFPSFIQISDKPTSIVEVTLNEKGSPSYTIVEDVAWDYILPDEQAKKKIEQADALIFGSLALRNTITKNTLLALQQSARLKVLDINLRKPFYSIELIKELFDIADIVKVNDEELVLICDYLGQIGSELENAIFIKNMFHLKGILVTRGANGAFYLDEQNNFTEHLGFKVDVLDTIGSGDSFLAGFLSKFLQEKPIIDCLEFACAVGAYVATQSGATPILSEELVAQKMSLK